MRLIVADLEGGKSCVVKEIEVLHEGEGLSALKLLDLALSPPPVVPSGRGEYRDFGVPIGDLRWLRARFPANQFRPVHYTNTIDFNTVIDGSIDLLLDDGSHRLDSGVCVVVKGVDHSWQVGPQGCEMSIIQIGTPGPSGH